MAINAYSVGMCGQNLSGSLANAASITACIHKNL